MSTTFSTVVNSSLLETMHRIQRIQIQNDISSSTFENSTKEFSYLRFEIPNTQTESIELPECDSIIKMIDKQNKMLI